MWARHWWQTIFWFAECPSILHQLVSPYRTIATIISDRVRNLWWWHLLLLWFTICKVVSFSVRRERTIPVLGRTRTDVKCIPTNDGLCEASKISFTYFTRNLNNVLQLSSLLVQCFSFVGLNRLSGRLQSKYKREDLILPWEFITTSIIYYFYSRAKLNLCFEGSRFKSLNRIISFEWPRLCQ